MNVSSGTGSPGFSRTNSTEPLCVCVYVPLEVGPLIALGYTFKSGN